MSAEEAGNGVVRSLVVCAKLVLPVSGGQRRHFKERDASSPWCRLVWHPTQLDGNERSVQRNAPSSKHRWRLPTVSRLRLRGRLFVKKNKQRE